MYPLWANFKYKVVDILTVFKYLKNKRKLKKSCLRFKGYHTEKGKNRKITVLGVTNYKKGEIGDVNLRLSEKDIELLAFLKKYKVMLATDSKKIYKAKGYHHKRLKVLEKERYIQRVDRYYIKLDIKGTRLMREMGYDYYKICRRQDYQYRVKEIVKIATLTIDSTIQFLPSWEMKNNNIHTEMGRKFIGELIYQEKDYITYYIAKDKKRVYVSQTVSDLQKTIEYKNAIVFLEDIKMLNKSNQYFMFGKESTIIIKASKENLEKMRYFHKIDLYEILKQIYAGQEVLLSNWVKADYMTQDREYIILMPFIDTEKLHKLNIFYNNNKDTKRKIDIITLQENKEKIEEILTNRTNIIEIDNLLGGIDGESKKV